MSIVMSEPPIDDPQLDAVLPSEAGPGETLSFRHHAARVVIFILKYALGIVLIAWMAFSGKLDFSLVGSLPAALIAECVALVLVQTLIGAFRVRYILDHQGVHTGLWQCVLYNCAGILYSAFLPGGISGDAVRAYLFMKAAPGHRLGVLGAMVLDRVLGLLSMVALGMTAALYIAISVEVIRPYLLVFGAILAALVGGLAMLQFIGARHKDHDVPFSRLPGLWAKLKRAVAELRIHEYPVGVLAMAVGQSVVIHLTAVAIIYACSLHAGAGLDFLRVFVATPIGLLVNAIPLSPGGLGIGENAFELLYRAIGGSHGATSFLIARFFLYAPALVGLGYILKRLAIRKRPMKERE
ncbi:MAG: lysylphosphatidylglycerol synthase transmembrane domain-containing protein [Bacillota bacterium]